MLNWLRFFQLERISFLIGFLTATLFWWLFLKSRKWFPEIKKSLQQLRENVRISQTSGLSIAIRKEAIKRAQTSHIAYKICSLQEILIEPYFLIPPILNSEFERSLFDSEVNSLIPFTPELPLIARNYPLPKIKISEAIQKSVRLMISGPTGSGKSVALAHLATLLAEKNANCGKSCGKIPFYFHVHDSEFVNFPRQDIATIIYKALSQKLPVSQLPKLAKFINYELEANNAVLIIDGFDELSKTDADLFMSILQVGLASFPNLQVVMSTSPYYSGNLEQLGFLNFPIAEMSNNQIKDLTNKWTGLWYDKVINSDTSKQHFLKEKLIYNWLREIPAGRTTLENTLYIWGALSGDLRGMDTLSIYESHFSRIFQSSYSPTALAVFTYQFVEKNTISLPSKSIDGSIASQLLEWGILRRSNDNIIFNYLDLLAFLASMYSKTTISFENMEEIVRNPLHYNYLGYVAARTSQFPEFEEVILTNQPPLYYNLMFILPWLHLTTNKITWRIDLFKYLLQIIQTSSTPFPIKVRLMSAFVYANDASLFIFLKQLLSQKDDAFKELALITYGSCASDDSLNSEIINMIDQSKSRLKKFIVLCLSIHSSDESLQALARLLLNADEDIRKLVAECLSTMQDQGIEILRDAITLEDILVRRSAIFGLVRLDEYWARELLNSLSIEDTQWVVRNVAHQAVEYLDSRPNISSKPILPVYEKEWIIQFAAEQNLGLSPEINPTPFLLKAAICGNDSVRINALADLPLNFNGFEDSDLFNLISDENKVISEKTLNALWRIFQSGVEIPTNYVNL